MDCWPFQPRSFAKLNVDDNKKWKTIFICEKNRKRDGNESFTKYFKFHISESNYPTIQSVELIFFL